ncbi:histidine kinase [Simiduia sp. 21SJ11W-1]|uniref:sensor histidine kinase n=1 Tax=Simiduia sp. 21SJ11W-1 TaxID=2909669 RepID=UPI0020A013F5|nr:histidine kinase [Simiduia sp. 21SJ11W-1]UTA47780.1 histidine kinase [Simiduia sp. 21SJ11W-1]
MTQATTAKQDSLPNLCTGPALLRLVMIAELLALVLVLNNGGLDGFNWVDLALTSLMVQWITLASAACICRLRPLLARWPLWAAVLLSYVLILTLTFLFTLLGQWFFLGYWWSPQPLDWSALGADLIVAAIFAGIGLQYFYLQQQLQRGERAQLEARIQALQSRIRPHFLFNAMNSIASLIAIDAERAERMVEDLSALFRASLSEATLVPVEQEVALARRYLAMEAARLGDRLQVDWRIEPLPGQPLMPSLLLQPLLENALYHGIGARREGGLLEIALAAENNHLHLLVRNPLGQSTPTPGNGIALANIRDRLAAHFGHAARCEVGVQDKHFCVRISYPITEQ